MLTHLSVLWPVTNFVAGESSFTVSFIHDSMSPMRLLSTEYIDVPQSEVIVHFSGPGVVASTKNE